MYQYTCTKQPSCFLFSSAKSLPTVVVGLNKKLDPKKLQGKGAQGPAYHFPPTGYLVFRDERMR
jgi:hypothetical protein